MAASRTSLTLGMLILFISMLIFLDFAAPEETGNPISSISRRELGVVTSAFKVLKVLLRILGKVIDIYGIVMDVRNILNTIVGQVDHDCGSNGQINCYNNMTTKCLKSESCWTSSLPSPSPSPSQSPTKVAAAEENSNPIIHKRELGEITSMVKNFMTSLGKAAGMNAYKNVLEVREALNTIISEVDRDCGSKDQDCHNKKTIQYLRSMSSPSPSPSLSPPLSPSSGGQASGHSSFYSPAKMDLSFISLTLRVTHLFLLMFVLEMN